MKARVNPFLRSASLAASIVLSLSSAHALTWDSDTGTADAQDGDGTWTTAAGGWWDGTTNVNWTGESQATFGAGTDGTYAITVGDDIYVQNGSLATPGLIFENSGYTLSAASSRIIRLGASGGTGSAFVKVASGKTASIGTNVRLIKSGSNGALNLVGGGTLRVASGGTLENSKTVVSQVAGGTTLHVDGGAVTYATSVILGQYSGGTGLGGKLKVDSGSFTMSGAGNLVLGFTSGDVSELTLNNGQVTVTAGDVRTDNGTADIILNGGTLSARRIYKTGGTLDLTMNGGTIKAASSASSSNFLTGLNSATVNGGGVTFDTNSQNITVGQALLAGTGSGTLTKTGLGSLTLTGANTYAGLTTINNGTLLLNTTGGGAIAGDVTLSSTAAARTYLRLQQDNQIAATSVLTMELTNLTSSSQNVYTEIALQGNSQTFAGINATWAAGIGSGSTIFIENRVHNDTGGGNGVLTIDGATDTTLGSRVNIRDGHSGTLSLAKAGAGTLTLGSSNTYTGNTSITGGTFAVTTTLGGGNYAGDISVGTGALFSINSGSSQTLSGNITGAGALTKAGSGTLTLSGSVSNYTGDTTINGGILAVANAGSFGGNTAISVASGATLRIDTNSAGSGRTVTINGSGSSFHGALQGAASTSVTWAGNVVLGSNEARIGGGDGGTLTLGAVIIDEQGGKVTVGGVISDGGSGHAVMFSRAPNSTTVLNSVNTYTGDTLFYPNTSDVTLKMGIANAIDSSSRVRTASGSAGGNAYFDLNGFNQNIRALVDDQNANLIVTNNSSTDDAVLTLSESNAANSASFDGWIQNGTTTKVSVVKSGAGTQTFTNANTYTGDTTITAGTLALTGTGSIANSANLVVNGTLDVSDITPGTFTVGAAQTLSGDGTINATGKTLEIAGTHAVGSSPGLQTVDGNLSYTSTSMFEWDLAANVNGGTGIRGTDFDAVDVSGDLTIASDATFKVIMNTGVNFTDTFWTNNQTFSNIWNLTGTLTSDWNAKAVSIFNTSKELQNFSSYGAFSITGSTLTWSAIPEPTSALAGLLIGAGLLRRRRTVQR